MQPADVFEPTTRLYRPRLHEVQEARPVVDVLYEPTAHDVQVAEVTAPTTLPYVPVEHAVHTCDVPAWAASPYLPAAHAAQALVPEVSAL